MTDPVQELADEFDLDLESRAEDFTDTTNVDSVEMEAREITVIQAFQPGEGSLKDETHNFVMRGGDQLSITVRHRPECPSCSHVLAEDEEPDTLAGECSICNRLTCHKNQSKCEGCSKVFCPDHASGHGLKDSSYCEDCLGDVEQDIRFDREMDEKEQKHNQEIERLDKQLQQEKQRKELELKQARQEREQIREDYESAVQLAEKLKRLKESGQEEEGGSGDQGGGRKPFSDTNVFGEGPTVTGGGSGDSEDDIPEWFKDAENQ